MKRLDVENSVNDGMAQGDLVQNEMTREEQDEALRDQAGPILEGIIAAARNVSEETKEITLARNGKVYFKLTIRPVSDSKAKELRRKSTRYAKNKMYGVKVPEETDMTQYRSRLVYEATVNKDETWDYKPLWKALEPEFPVVQGWQTVDLALLAGEKDRIVDEINLLSGYVDDEEESDEEKMEDTIKN